MSFRSSIPRKRARGATDSRDEPLVAHRLTFRPWRPAFFLCFKTIFDLNLMYYFNYRCFLRSGPFCLDLTGIYPTVPQGKSFDGIDCTSREKPIAVLGKYCTSREIWTAPRGKYCTSREKRTPFKGAARLHLEGNPLYSEGRSTAPRGKNAAPEGKATAPQGKDHCTPREGILHPEGKNTAPRGKKLAPNFLLTNNFSFAQYSSTFFQYFPTTTSICRCMLLRTYQMLLLLSARRRLYA